MIYKTYGQCNFHFHEKKKISELPQIKCLKIPKQIIPEILRENKWADFLN